MSQGVWKCYHCTDLEFQWNCLSKRYVALFRETLQCKYTSPETGADVTDLYDVKNVYWHLFILFLQLAPSIHLSDRSVYILSSHMRKENRNWKVFLHFLSPKPIWWIASYNSASSDSEKYLHYLKSSGFESRQKQVEMSVRRFSGIKL